jgi:hypothetical protein
MLEKWLMEGDTFTSWTGVRDLLVTKGLDERGYFWATNVEGVESRWHCDAVNHWSVTRPVADTCPDSCPRCGFDLASAGRPREHAWEGAQGQCSFTWEPATVIITGRDNIDAARDRARLHFWRLQARLKVNAGMTPRAGWTVKGFNEMYGVKAKSWTEVLKLADAMINA